MEKNSKVWLIVLFAVAVYLLMGIYADFGKLSQAMKDFRWAFLLPLFALTTTNYLLRFIKWDFFLKRAGVYLNLKDNLFVFFSGLAMIITPGKIGEIWKGWLIKDINGEELSKTVPVVIVERITDVLGLAILSLFGVLYYKQVSHFGSTSSFLIIFCRRKIQNYFDMDNIKIRDKNGEICGKHQNNA